jgi:hypothetical protein
MEVLDLPAPPPPLPPAAPEPAFDPMALSPGEVLPPTPPPTLRERLVAFAERHGAGFACGAIATAIVLRVL